MPRIATFETQTDCRRKVFATAEFKWGLGGLGSITLASLHCHRDTAKKGMNSPEWKKWVEQLAEAIRSTGARILAGDLNMGLLALAPSLRARGLLCELVCSHREICTVEPVHLLAPDGLTQSMRYDSCGIWVVGGVVHVKRLTVDSQCLAGALHPAFLELVSGELKKMVRGYPLVSYVTSGIGDEELRRAREEPSTRCREKVVLEQ
jgi:hypothetical protein